MLCDAAARRCAHDLLRLLTMLVFISFGDDDSCAFELETRLVLLVSFFELDTFVYLGLRLLKFNDLYITVPRLRPWLDPQWRFELLTILCGLYCKVLPLLQHGHPLRGPSRLRRCLAFSDLGRRESFDRHYIIISIRLYFVKLFLQVVRNIEFIPGFLADYGRGIASVWRFLPLRR